MAIFTKKQQSSPMAEGAPHCITRCSLACLQEAFNSLALQDHHGASELISNAAQLFLHPTQSSEEELPHLSSILCQVGVACFCLH